MATKDKYDRQIRIWGADGQFKLNTSKVICLGVTGAGAETMKNLVLPGIGSIVLVSNKSCCQRDLGTNFWITPEAVVNNRNLAEETLENLLEMNSDAKGTFFDTDPETFLQTHQSELDTATLILADQLSLKTCKALDEYIRSSNRNQRLVILTNAGLVGMIRLCLPEYSSWQTKIDNKAFDLRVNGVWPELETFVTNLDIDNKPSESHKFVPFPAVLIHLVKKWKLAHNGQTPKSMDDMDEFREFIQKNAIFDTSASKGHFNTETNFAEAYENANHARKLPTDIPDDVQKAFDFLQEKLESGDPFRDQFFYLASALKKFHSSQSRFPVAGDFPDCDSDTDTFLALKNIYLNKSKQDLSLFTTFLASETQDSMVEIDADDIKLFCRNWQTITAFKCRSLTTEHTLANVEDWQWDGDSGPEWYFIIRAYLQFKETHNSKPPGPSDYETMRTTVASL